LCQPLAGRPPLRGLMQQPIVAMARGVVWAALVLLLSTSLSSGDLDQGRQPIASRTLAALPPQGERCCLKSAAETPLAKSKSKPKRMAFMIGAQKSGKEKA
jgi:hypothetical protein